MNDIMIIYIKKNINRIQFFKKSSNETIWNKSVKKLKWFVKIKIIQDRVNRKIRFYQNSYIFKVMTKFHLRKMKISKTFLAEISRINEKTKNSNHSNSQRFYVFQQRIKLLNLAIIIFRSDIIFATAKLIQFLKNFDSNHVMIVNKIINYFNNINNFVIEFSKNSSEIFFCANDVAFASNKFIKKNLNDYLFKFYNNSID